jgi:hypothetical protein
MSHPTHDRIIDELKASIAKEERQIFYDESLNLITVSFLTHRVESLRDVLEALESIEFDNIEEFYKGLLANEEKERDKYFDTTTVEKNVLRGFISGQQISIQILKGHLYASS